MSGSPSVSPAISVVVPVRDAAATLARCLDALVAQDLPRERYEVLVDAAAACPHS